GVALVPRDHSELVEREVKILVPELLVDLGGLLHVTALFPERADVVASDQHRLLVAVVDVVETLGDALALAGRQRSVLLGLGVLGVDLGELSLGLLVGHLGLGGIRQLLLVGILGALFPLARRQR